MSFESIFSFFSSLSPWLVAKVFVLVLLLLYVFFAGIVTRQIELMNQVLEAKFSPVIKLIALAHLLLTIFIFILALIIL